MKASWHWNSHDGFLNFKTSKYKLHFYETPSGLKFIMNTDLTVGNIRDVLQQIFSSVSFRVLFYRQHISFIFESIIIDNILGVSFVITLS